MTTDIWGLIDIGSFSSLWYWIFLGVFWARVMQAPMGVPVDTGRRAHDGSGAAQSDLEALSGVRIGQELATARGPVRLWRAAGWAFVLGVLGGLAVIYRVELAQAVLAILAPYAAIVAIEARAAIRMADVPDMPALIRAHGRLRLQVQGIGIAAVFLTTIYGMLRLLAQALA